MTEAELYKSVGGSQRAYAAGPDDPDAWYFGWIPFAERDEATTKAGQDALTQMPAFAITGRSRIHDGITKADLTTCWKDPRVVAATDGKIFTGTHQFTGSCFPASTPVRMADGSEKMIEDVRVGDQVISHTGEKRSVVRTFHRRYTGTLHTFHVKGWRFPVTMTHDHDCLVVERSTVSNWGNSFTKKKAEATAVGERFLIPEPFGSRHPQLERMEKTCYGLVAAIEKIDREEVTDVPVYCCEVEVEHSLIVNGLAQHQCVGAGGGNAIFTLSAVEVARLNDPEQALIPFWLIPYGRSRFHAGMRGPGEGSLGSTFARAVREDGVVPANLAGLPPYKWADGLEWGAGVEREWSAGERISQEWLDRARKHLIKTTASLKSADDMREAIVNGYAVTWCGSWGGMMQCKVEGEPPVLLNHRQGTWNHQQSCHAWWDHPQLGEIFWIINQWGLRAHGTCPSGILGGGYWIKKTDADWQCRNGECYAFSQFTGFPSPDWDIDWAF